MVDDVLGDVVVRALEGLGRVVGGHDHDDHARLRARDLGPPIVCIVPMLADGRGPAPPERTGRSCTLWPMAPTEPAAAALDLPLDAHLHTDLSPDADVPLDAYAALARARNVAELAITDHLDFEPGAPAYGYAEFDRRERVVREAAERWEGRPAIRLGVEVTYQAHYEAEIRAHLRAHAVRLRHRVHACGAGAPPGAAGDGCRMDPVAHGGGGG